MFNDRCARSIGLAGARVTSSSRGTSPELFLLFQDRLNHQPRSLVAARVGVAGAGVMIVDGGVVPGDDQVEAGDDPEDVRATVAGGDERIGRGIDEESASLLVGSVEPPVEAVITGPDGGDVSTAADAA